MPAFALMAGALGAWRHTEPVAYYRIITQKGCGCQLIMHLQAGQPLQEAWRGDLGWYASPSQLLQSEQA